jgi:serine/threonine-protein kinase PpkA
MFSMKMASWGRDREMHLAVSLLACIIFLHAGVAVAQQRKPLLMTGKRTLFQRVVTHPGAHLFASADDSAPLLQKWIKPFTVFYVYERKSVDGSEWLKVSVSSTGNANGWIKAAKASDWKQSLTLKFTERTGRLPVLFFKDMQSLEQVAASEFPGKDAARLASEFATIQSGNAIASADFPVIAMEPREEAISGQQFYLMPIFQTAEIFEGVKFLKLASIDPGSGELPDDLELRTGIAFVIDTTISMKPYINRTREAVRKIYDAIETAGLVDKVAFGLVGFRSSTEKTPELEYVSRVFSDLRDARERIDFERALASMEEAKVSTHSFNEDAFAGLKTALEDLNWKPYSSRLIFLISDAGAIRNDDPYSSTGMNEAEMADLAASKGTKVFALHLKTPAGRKVRPNNHTFARTQYRTLTRHSDPRVGDLYVPIEAEQVGTGVKGFGEVLEGVAGQMVDLVRATSGGKRLQLPNGSSPLSEDAAKAAARKAAILGYAMQLEFLGRRVGIQAPQVVTSWVSDMDLARPDTPTFQVAVLLTKNQLSDLHQRLKVILDQAQRTKRTGARDFFQSILSAAAQTSRDPSQFSKRPSENLGQLGFLAEFLDDLPYRSSIMRLTEEDWYRLSVGEQQAIVDDLKSKIRRYEQYHDDVANWTSFGPEDPGDSVYRVPLSVMP